MPECTTGTPVIAPAIQSQVIALRAAGKSKRKIAEELGIHRNTVNNVIQHMQADVPDYTAIVHKLAGRALTRIDQVIDSDTDTAKWTLEHTVFRPDVPQTYHVHSDIALVNAAGMVPSTTSTTSTPSLPSSTERTSTAMSTGTEAPAKPGYSDIGVCSQTNFSNFSDEQLEQELARRRAARSGVIEAEVVDAAR